MNAKLRLTSPKDCANRIGLRMETGPSSDPCCASAMTACTPATTSCATPSQKNPRWTALQRAGSASFKRGRPRSGG